MPTKYCTTYEYICVSVSMCLASLDITLLHTLASSANDTIAIRASFPLSLLFSNRLASEVWDSLPIVDFSPLSPAEDFLFSRDLLFQYGIIVL